MEKALSIVDTLENVLVTCNDSIALKILEDLKKVLKEFHIPENLKNVTQRKNNIVKHKTALNVIELLKKKNIMCITKYCLQSVSSEKNNLCTHCNSKHDIAMSVVDLLKKQNIMCSTIGCWQCVSYNTHKLCLRCNDRREITEKIEQLQLRYCKYSHRELFESYKETLINQCFQNITNNQFVYLESMYLEPRYDLWESVYEHELCMFNLIDFGKPCSAYCSLLADVKYGIAVLYEESNVIKIRPTEFFKEYIPIGVSVRQDFITFKAGDVIRFYERW